MRKRRARLSGANIRSAADRDVSIRKSNPWEQRDGNGADAHGITSHARFTARFGLVGSWIEPTAVYVAPDVRDRAGHE
jgi:hypothetical protein